VRAAIGVGRARDWESFRNALRDWAVPVFNFGFADKSGHVGFQCAGRVPLRGRAERGYRDAAAAEDAWVGYIPFEDLPYVVDPPRGYVASANERVAPDDYPYPLFGAFGAGHRAARLHQALGGTSKLDRQHTLALQNDIKSCRAERLCPPLLQWLAQTDQADTVLVRQALAAWDYQYGLDSSAPTVFETFMEVWQERVAHERFDEPMASLVKASSGAAACLIEQGDDELHWFSGDFQAEIVAAAHEAVERLQSRYGAATEWRWGNVHQAHWRHPVHSAFDIGPTPVDGGSDTLRNTGAGQPAFAASGGAEYRVVVDFAEPERFLAVQNIGNSGQPGSPHYADQFDAWRAGTYHVVGLDRSDVEAAAEGRTILQPST